MNDGANEWTPVENVHGKGRGRPIARGLFLAVCRKGTAKPYARLSVDAFKAIGSPSHVMWYENSFGTLAIGASGPKDAGAYKVSMGVGHRLRLRLPVTIVPRFRFGSQRIPLDQRGGFLVLDMEANDAARVPETSTGPIVIDHPIAVEISGALHRDQRVATDARR